MIADEPVLIVNGAAHVFDRVKGTALTDGTTERTLMLCAIARPALLDELLERNAMVLAADLQDPIAIATRRALHALKGRGEPIGEESVIREVECDAGVLPSAAAEEVRAWLGRELRDELAQVPLSLALGWSRLLSELAARRRAALAAELAGNGPPYKPHSELVVDVGRRNIPPIRSYSTGIPELDNLLGGGVNTRELAVVLGPPGGCKTAFAISLAVFLQRYVPVLYASTELEQHELAARVAANVLRKPWSGIRRGTLSRDQITDALDGLNIRLLGCDVLPMDGEAALRLIEREALWIKEQQNQAPVVFVDYLQDLARGAEGETRSCVGDRARTLHAMSQRIDCGMVVISSVARTYYSARKAAEFREADDPTVYLAAAKESGDVDYKAARVMFLDAEDERDKEERAVRIAVAKSRDCRTGFAGARVHQESGRFLPASDVLGEMSSSGRAVEATTLVSDEADEAMLKRLVREHADGKRELCTKRYLRVGNSLGKRKLGKERAEAALDRLVQAGRARVVTVERVEVEGRAPKARDVYEPIGVSQ